MASLLSEVQFSLQEATANGLCDSGGCQAVTRALRTLYAAAYVTYNKTAAANHEYWTKSPDIIPTIYRTMMSLQWPRLARGNVNANANKHAVGACLGLTRGRQPNPYVHMPDTHVQLLNLVVQPAKQQCPHFVFTSAQFNVGVCSGLHTDSANVGPSLVLALGPHAGGELWTYQPGEGKSA